MGKQGRKRGIYLFAKARKSEEIQFPGCCRNLPYQDQYFFQACCLATNQAKQDAWFTVGLHKHGQGGLG